MWFSLCLTSAPTHLLLTHWISQITIRFEKQTTQKYYLLELIVLWQPSMMHANFLYFKGEHLSPEEKTISLKWGNLVKLFWQEKHERKHFWLESLQCLHLKCGVFYLYFLNIYLQIGWQLRGAILSGPREKWGARPWSLIYRFHMGQFTGGAGKGFH